VLDVDGAVEKSRLVEFRAKNIALNNQLGEHKKQFEGIHPDEARRLFEKQALQAGEIEKVVEGRLRAARRGSVIRLALSIAGDNPGEP
jgi:hypothetical protein